MYKRKATSRLKDKLQSQGFRDGSARGKHHAGSHATEQRPVPRRHWAKKTSPSLDRAIQLAPRHGISWIQLASHPLEVTEPANLRAEAPEEGQQVVDGAVTAEPLRQSRPASPIIYEAHPEGIQKTAIGKERQNLGIDFKKENISFPTSEAVHDVSRHCTVASSKDSTGLSQEAPAVLQCRHLRTRPMLCISMANLPRSLAQLEIGVSVDHARTLGD